MNCVTQHSLKTRSGIAFSSFSSTEKSYLPEKEPSRLTPFALALLLLYSGTLFLFYLGGARTFTAHEGFVVQVASEMLDSGDWIVPRILGEPYLERPPLNYWAVALLGKWLGITEFTARLPSALVAILGVFLVASLAARWYGSTFGLLVGLVQATMFYTLIYSRLAESDIFLWTIVLACLLIFSHNVVTLGLPRWYSGRLAFFFCLGLTQLVKGPVFGAVIAMVPCAGYVLLQRDWKGLRWLLFWPGWILFFLVALAWPVTILTLYPETVDLWLHHTVGRLDSTTAINPKPFWYYATTFPWQTLPWTFFVLVGMVTSIRQFREPTDNKNRLLWVWFALPVLVLTLVQGKHHHYLIYALPPCSIWAVEGLFQVCRQTWFKSPHLWLGTLLLVGGGISAYLALTCTGPLAFYWWDGLILGLIALAALAGIGWSCCRKNFRLALVSLFSGLWLLFGYVHSFPMPKTDSYRFETALLRQLHKEYPADTVVLIYGFYPQREMYYLNLRAEIMHSPEQVAQRSRQLPHALILSNKLSEEQLRQLGPLTCVAEIPTPRRGHNSPIAQMAVYRLD